MVRGQAARPAGRRAEPPARRSDIAAIDADGDGLDELYVPVVTTIGGAASGVVRFAGDAESVLTAPDADTTFRVDAGAAAAAGNPGDVDGDGRSDVAIGPTSALYLLADSAPGVVSALGDAFAEAHNWSFTTTPVGEVNGDQVPDVLTRPDPARFFLVRGGS